jgi:phosphatidate cytidylyltransferase
MTAAVLLSLLLAAMFLLPGNAWQIVLLVPLFAAAREWARLAALSRVLEAVFLLALAGAVAALWSVPAAPTPQSGRALAISHAVYVSSVAFWVVIVPCWMWLKLAVRNSGALIIAGVAVLVPTWLALAQAQRQPALLLVLLGVVWIADTAAYLFGRVYGRVKLAPAFSPGKTVEGALGALAAVTVYALGVYLARVTTHDVDFLVVAFLGLAVFSIVGDLFESWLKRCAGVKDSGAILPGHGGMLDRIDGVMAALPLALLIFF